MRLASQKGVLRQHSAGTQTDQRIATYSMLAIPKCCASLRILSFITYIKWDILLLIQIGNSIRSNASCYIARRRTAASALGWLKWHGLHVQSWIGSSAARLARKSADQSWHRVMIDMELGRTSKKDSIFDARTLPTALPVHIVTINVSVAPVCDCSVADTKSHKTNVKAIIFRNQTYLTPCWRVNQVT